MDLKIANSIFDDHPEFVLGIVTAHGIDNSQDVEGVLAALRTAEAELPAKFTDIPVSQHPHIQPWREAYRKFGAKPKKYPSSIENLSKRVLKGGSMPHINNLVTLYNTISLRHILPVGGEDLDNIVGDVVLRHAGDDEPAVCMLGDKEARPPYANEIIYTDNVGAICRRWNWKEADRTKLTQNTKNLFLVIEALPPVSRDVVEVAIKQLADLVSQYCGGTVSTAFLDKQNSKTKLI